MTQQRTFAYRLACRCRYRVNYSVTDRPPQKGTLRWCQKHRMQVIVAVWTVTRGST